MDRTPGGRAGFSRETRALLARADAGLTRAAGARARARGLVRDAVVAVAYADCAIKTISQTHAQRLRRPVSNWDTTGWCRGLRSGRPSR